jgi:hypothetical protein
MKYETFDFETIEINNKLFPYCIAYTQNGEIKYSEVQDNSYDNATNIILYKFKPNCIYYAHNLIFDFLLILPSLVKYNINFN